MPAEVHSIVAKENLDPAATGSTADDGVSSLAKLFHDGQQSISTCKNGDLFQELDKRSLSAEEEEIIRQRVEHQRKMLEMFERSEKRRKVSELQDVCPDLTEDEASRALELCGGKEDETASRLTSDPGFVRKVQALVGGRPAPVAAPRPTRSAHRGPRSFGQRPKLVDANKLDGSVFVGSFRGKGAPAAAKAPRRAGASRSSESDSKAQQTEDPAPKGSAMPLLVPTPLQQDQKVETAAPTHGGPAAPNTPETPAPEALPSGGVAAEAAGKKEHVLVRVLPDGSLAPISTGGLKKVRKEMHLQGDDVSATTMSADSRGPNAMSPPTVTKPSLDSGKLDPSTALKPKQACSASTDVAFQLAANAISTQTTDVQVKHLKAMAAEIRAQVMLCLDDICPDTAEERRIMLESSIGSAAIAKPTEGIPAEKTRLALGDKGNNQQEGIARQQASDAACDQRKPLGQAAAVAFARERPARSTRCNKSLAEADLAQENIFSVRSNAVLPDSCEMPNANLAGKNGTAISAENGPLHGPGTKEAPGDDIAGKAPSEAGPTRKRLKLSLTKSPKHSSDNCGQQRLVATAIAVTSSACEQAAAEKSPADSGTSYGKDHKSDMKRSTELAKKDDGSADAKSMPQFSLVKRSTRSGAAVGNAHSEDFQASSIKSDVPASLENEEQAEDEKHRHRAPTRTRGVSYAASDVAGAHGEQTCGDQDAKLSEGSKKSRAKLEPKTAKSYDSEETCTEDEASETKLRKPLPASSGMSSRSRERSASRSSANPRISNSGRVGRVRQKAGKAVELLAVGERVRGEQGWSNQGYIFPEGFKSQTVFRSSVDVDQLCMHECSIIGKGGKFFPKPTFMVVAMDRKDEPLLAASCTGCWTQVLKRINAEIEALRRAGDPRPAPPKTAIAGPEYFGLVDPFIKEQIEALDTERICVDYWEGSQHLEALKAGHEASKPLPRSQRKAPPAQAPTAQPRRQAGRRGKMRNRDGDADLGGLSADEDDSEVNYTSNRWSAVSRSQRYKKRCGGDALDDDNPLPDFMDPITLEPVVDPAISPSGHVMGSATWKAILAEQGKCPFTQAPLNWSQLKVLTKSNIHLYKDLIKK